jgi:ABC-type Zn uptake system ZnuABC Zn-binding protein ZnuA
LHPGKRWVHPVIKSPVHTGNKPIVAVSVVPEQGFIEAIAKDLVEVVVMIPPRL